MRSVEHISRCEVAQYCCAMVDRSWDRNYVCPIRAISVRERDLQMLSQREAAFYA